LVAASEGLSAHKLGFKKLLRAYWWDMREATCDD
jgi:hypothetical protein